MRRMLPLLNGKRRIFGKFLMSYFLILLIPIVVGAYAYYQTVNVVRDDAAELNLAVLEQSEDALNRLLTEIRDIVSLLSLDSDVLNLMITADRTWSANTVYKFSLLQKNELNMLSTNLFFSNLFIYLQKSEVIISRDQIDRLHTHPMQIDEVPFGQWLEKVIASKQMNQYLRLENVTNGRMRGNYLAYVNSLPAGNNSNIDGAVIILIDEKSIVPLFSRLLVAKGSYAYITNQDKEIIISAPSHIEHIDSNSKDMFITSTKSKKNGWTYVTGLPADVVFAKADYIKQINWTIALIASAVGCLIALLFAYRNSKPLSELLESVKEFANGDTDRKSNEMDLLTTTVHQIISNNRSLNVTMNQQLPLLQSACLERLLKSGFNNEREMSAHLDQAQITLNELHFFVAIIKIHSANYSSEEELEVIAMKSQMKSILFQELGDGCYVHDLKGEQVGLILSFNGPSVEEPMNDLVKQLGQYQTRFLKDYSIMSSIGIGLVYHNGMDVWRSFNEASQVLDYQDPDMTQQLLRFDTFSNSVNHYYYPLDLELKLMNTVKTGDSDALLRLFEFIGAQNFQVKQLSVWRKKQLFLEMQGTLQKLTEQIQYMPDTIELQLDRIVSLNPDDMESGLPLIKSITMSICEHIKQQKNNKYQSMFESMKKYISENYLDNNLSLNMLASEHKQTESFVSIFFKEQMGITFSEYLEQLRLDVACKLLKESDLPIQDIAIRVGYNSDKSFRRAFKRACGIQPTTYRNEEDITFG